MNLLVNHRNAPFPVIFEQTALPHAGTGASGSIIDHRTESSQNLGMHTTFWNNLAVEVPHLLKAPDVFGQRRTPLAGCCYVLVVVNGAPNAAVSFLSILSSLWC
jgi:hypothetical protein